ncbi:MAG: hypothetical protein ABSH51_20030 [Solirubrobacteraceae bacterium]|jgi:hypothetical protein
MPPRPTRPLVLDAALAGSSIAATITTPSGDRRDFHGWIELTTAIEALLRSADPGPPPPADRDLSGVRPAG